MKINYLLVFAVLFTGSIIAQNKIIKANVAYQTTLKLDIPKSKNEAIKQFCSNQKLGKGYTFEPMQENIDLNGTAHQRHQQFYRGIKIEFGVLITHSNNNETFLLNGEIYNAENINLTPGITSQQAFQYILNLKPNTSYLWEDAAQAALMDYKKPAGELVILPNISSGEIKLAYKFDVYSTEPLARDDIYVDATSGAILFKNAIIKHANKFDTAQNDDKKIASVTATIQGNAATRYSGNQAIETTLNATLNKYVLQDFTRGDGILTYNNERKVTYQNVDFKDNDNNWTAAEYNNANKDNAALDAHWGAEKTYDFWMNFFNRSSYDGNGAVIKSYVHYRKVANTSLANAFWNGTAMSYGDGNNTVSPLTCVDVCGHEIGHAVCSKTANLVYANQSGGINEGYSDIWGACIENYAKNGTIANTPPSNVWLLAEELGSSPFRSMSNPLSKGDPDTYLGTNWVATADDGSCVPGSGNDNCGVHTNSGVLNHWFYILTVGKSGTNNAPVPDTYNVTGIGMLKAAQIAFFAERDYLTPNATYLDVRNATLQVAASMYCGSSQEVISVTNAWHAVNVGDAFVVVSKDVALKNTTRSLNVACGAAFSPVITIENAGTTAVNSVTISYSVDGAAAVSTVWNGNLAPCQTFNYTVTLPALNRGTHTVVISTTTANDGNLLNNSRTLEILSNDSGTIDQTNTFENTSDDIISYESSGTNLLWQRGVASGQTMSNAVAGNSKVYATNLSGLYPNSIKSFLVSQCYNVSNLSNPVVKFDMGFDLEQDYDLIYLQYSLNGGTSWAILGTSGDTNWYNSERIPNDVDCQNCVGAQWTGDGLLSNPRGGNNAQKREYSHSLSDFGFGSASPQTNIIFRFVFQSDEGLQKEGVIIDNFVVTGSPQLGTNAVSFDTFSIVPNPSNGKITINLSTSDDVNLNLFDLRGRKIIENNYVSNGSIFNQEIDFGILEKGVYLITVASEGKTATKKLIIQ